MDLDHRHVRPTQREVASGRRPAMKIAVFCPNLIGDTVMATPTFRALRRVSRRHDHRRDQTAGGPDARWRPLVRRLDLFRSTFQPSTRADRGGRSPTAPRAVRVGGTFAEYVSQLPGWRGWPDSRTGRLRPLAARDVIDRPGCRKPATRRGGGYRRRSSSLISCWLGGSAARSTRSGLELATTADDEAAAERAFVSLGLGGERRSRLPEHRRRVWPGQELATSAFRRAGTATGRRCRCVDPGPLRPG